MSTRLALLYTVTATLNGEEHSCTLTLPAEYAVSGLSESEAELLIDNTADAYSEFYGDDAGDDTYNAVWEDVEVEFEGTV